MDSYKNPLEERYSSEEMLYNFSPNNKFRNWRKLWIALAEIEKDLGLEITDEQISQLKENAENIDYEKAEKYEKKFRHDVMAHVHTYGDAAPLAKGIIHLGATSAFVGDNTDLIQIRDGLLLIRKQLVNVIKKPVRFCPKIQRFTDAWFYTLSTCTINDRRETRDFMASILNS
jgi:Adenylosuccinate lyase